MPKLLLLLAPATTAASLSTATVPIRDLSPTQRQRRLAADAQSVPVLREGLLGVLRYSKAQVASLTPQELDRLPRIVEAVSEGVSCTTLEHSADGDSLALPRPRLSNVEKARAIRLAFHYSGRPYDFDFDFATDAKLVCTELIYKSFEPASGFKGLTFPVFELLGRKVTPANEIARQFEVQHGSASQPFDLIVFLDGQERHGQACEASLVDFLESWKRPKWHTLLQNPPAFR